ncbi:polysaccharide biosynthesis/export family protein [Croceibacterium ferulae]|uniref:polysaccharide biosynthesis/export family protein n=1 Tax=Croceibacterium ferulae TaxID=1854641 RepID=UPI000EAF807C|nr:polysaccharide biosynthesis/export family protein [Croceibacterium ferulae]
MPVAADHPQGATFSCRRFLLSAGVALSVLALAGCNTLGSSGPSTRRVLSGESEAVASGDIQIIPLNDAVARRLVEADEPNLFSEVLGESPSVGSVIGRGDVIDVTIWEAPPAALFGMLGGATVLTAATSLEIAKSTDMPQQMVDEQGTISLPFIGTLQAAGKTFRQLEADIRARLQGIANQPQVIVGLARNATSNVTVIGEVNMSARVPLTPRGERLLDVLASAGGVRQQVDKMTIQITRGSQVVALPMNTVIRDPRQNITLKADDVVTAIFQPYSFVSMGATGLSAEIPFEATGLTLSQALGRVAGVQDARADVKGVFIFRLEDPAVLGPEYQGARTTPDGKVPVIYRANLSDPGSFFLAQSFRMHNGDVLYVSNAPGVDLQKFVSIITQTAFSIINITQTVN